MLGSGTGAREKDRLYSDRRIAATSAERVCRKAARFLHNTFRFPHNTRMIRNEPRGGEFVNVEDREVLRDDGKLEDR